MKRLVLALVALMLWWAPARATFMPILADQFDEYGVVNPVSATFGPYRVAAPSQFQIKSSASVPWRTGTGYYMEASSGNFFNPGPGAYAYFGNPCQTPAYVGWVRFVSGSAGAAFLRFDDTVDFRNAPPTLTDLEWLQVTGSGPYSVQILSFGSTLAGSTGSIFAANTWYLLGWFVRHGVANSSNPVTQGATQLQINGSVVINNTNVLTTGGAVDASDTLVLDDEFSSNNIIDWGPYVYGCVSSPSDMPVALHAIILAPTANGTPLQWTPSTGSNYSNVNGFPAGSGYNYSDTIGDEDIYSLLYQNFYTPFVTMLAQQSETDSAQGARVGIAIVKSAGGTITNGGIGLAAQNNSSYSFYEWPVTYSAGMSIGMKVQN